MLLNPFFGFAGDTPLPEGITQAVEPVDGDPFQEILQGVQLANEGKQSHPSGYPSLAQVIAEAIAADDPQGSTGTSQHPGLERHYSDHPHSGQTAQVQTDPEVPIEPGLPNGVTRVASRQQVLPDAHGGSLNHLQTDPAVQPDPSQTELPFTEGITVTADGHEPPNTIANPPQPQTSTFASPDPEVLLDPETDQATPMDGQIGRDDSANVPPAGEQVRDDRPLMRNPETQQQETDVQQDRTPQTPRPTLERAEDSRPSVVQISQTPSDSRPGITHRTSASTGAVAEESIPQVVRDEAPEAAGPRTTSQPGSVVAGDGHVVDERPSAWQPNVARRTDQPETGLRSDAPQSDRFNGLTREASETSGPLPRQQSLFNNTQLAELTDTSVASPEEAQHEGSFARDAAPSGISTDTPSIPAGEWEPIEQDAPQTLARESRIPNIVGEGEIEQVPAEPSTREARPELTANAARIDAVLRRLDSTTLARDIATTLSAQGGTAEPDGAISDRVGDLLRSMDAVAERAGVSQSQAPSAGRDVAPEGSVPAERLPAAESGQTAPRRMEQGSPVDTEVEHLVNVSRTADRTRQESDSEESLARAARQPESTPALRDAVRQTLDKDPMREDVRIEQVTTGPANKGRAPFLADQGSTPAFGESEVQLQDLLPASRPEGQILSSTPAAPDQGMTPSIGAVSSGLGSLPSVETVVDQPAAAPTDVEETKVTQQIVRGARFLTREGANQVTLRLDPPELGEVTIRLSSVDKALSGEIRVESRMVQEIVNRNMADLRESLGSQGIQVDNIEVTVESGGRSGVDRDGGSAFRREAADRDGQPASERDRQSRERDEQQDRPPRQPLEDGRFDAVA